MYRFTNAHAPTDPTQKQEYRPNHINKTNAIYIKRVPAFFLSINITHITHSCTFNLSTRH